MVQPKDVSSATGSPGFDTVLVLSFAYWQPGSHELEAAALYPRHP